MLYTANAGYSGQDSFSFKANDGQADGNVAAVTITVSKGNAPPVANAQSVQATAGVALAVTLSASDQDRDALTYSVVAFPGHGSLGGTPPNLTYTANANYSGQDSFSFKANDGQADSDVATVSVTVKAACALPNPATETRTQNCPAGQTGSIIETRTASCPNPSGSFVWSAWIETSNTCVAPNRNPVAVDDQFGPYPLNQKVTVSMSDILRNDRDPDGNVIKVVAYTASGFDVNTWETLDEGTQALTVTPGIDNKTGGFRYRISDGKGGTAEANVNIAWFDAPAMVSVLGGRFTMGSPVSETDRDSDETQHQVTVDSFSMSKYEITRDQFAEFVNDTGYSATGGCVYWDGTQFATDPGRDWQNPGYLQEGDHPVVCVSWNDAQEYANWLSEKAGKAYRLPTEAEWEYAARAGTTTARYWGSNDAFACVYENIADKTNFTGTVFPCDDGFHYTSPTGSFLPNAFGLYDMLGNVWEWTCSDYADPYDGHESTCNNSASNRRAYRGGSWSLAPRYVRSALRIWDVPAYRLDLLGFRLAQD
jgi:formylglycine-generating enzyme required for sulfatase activity